MTAPEIKVICGDAIESLRALPEKSVHCAVTSPPYFGLRDYKTKGQLGLEKTPEEYVASMVAVMREVWRVLRDDGTLWLNLGDSYANDSKWGGSSGGKHVEALHGDTGIGRGKKETGLKSKDLIGIPWRVAFALQADGWYLRSDIIWHKPNPMPESVRDRPTKSHEYIFLLTKKPKYYYDQFAISEPLTCMRLRGSGPMVNAGTGRNKRSVWTVNPKPFPGSHFATFPPKLIEPCILAGCPQRCCAKCGAPWVRVVGRASTGYDGSRYGGRAVAATGGAISGGTERSTLGSSGGALVGVKQSTGFTPSCKCKDAGSVPGTVLDPFAGSGTVGEVAQKHGRSAVLIELNPDYLPLIYKRIEQTMLPVGGD